MLLQTAAAMYRAGLPNEFIVKAVELGCYYEGVFDLCEIWAEESDPKECDILISEIQNEIAEAERGNNKIRTDAWEAFFLACLLFLVLIVSILLNPLG